MINCLTMRDVVGGTERFVLGTKPKVQDPPMSGQEVFAASTGLVGGCRNLGENPKL